MSIQRTMQTLVRGGQWRKIWGNALLAVLGMTVSVSAHSNGAMLIPAGDKSLRDDIQWLVDRRVIDISVSTWPLPVSQLEHALANRRRDGLTSGDVHALISVKNYIKYRMANTVGVAAAFNAGKEPVTGFESQSRAFATSSVYGQGGNEYFAGRLQVNHLLSPVSSKQSRVNLEGSYISSNVAGQNLYFGQIGHWWGPGQEGSLIWSNAGTAIPGFGLKRAQELPIESRFLSWVGPWGYDLFFGQMQHDTAVSNPKVFALRVYARPTKGLEIGASRFIQWGGGGRGNGLGSLWDAFIGNSNTKGGDDPGNEIAGIDVRYTFNAFNNPLTLYGQLIGEDEAGLMPSKHIIQIGAQYKHFSGRNRIQWHAEATDTASRHLFGLREALPGATYRHHIYTNGLYHDGLPIAYFAGGKSQVYSVGVSVVPSDYQNYSKFSVRLMQANINSDQDINFAFPKRDKWYGVSAGVSWILRPLTFNAAASVMRSRQSGANNSFGLLFSVDIPLAVM